MALWHRYAWVAYGAVLLGVFGHATSEFMSVLTGLSGPEVSVWRFLLGGTGLLVFALLFPGSRDLLTPFKTHGLQLVLLSVLGVGVPYLLFHWSLDYATVTQVATFVTSAPIFIGIVNLWLNKQPFGTSKIISGIFAIIGVVLLLTDGYLGLLLGSTDNLTGLLMVSICMLAIGFFVITIKPIIVEYGALRITALTFFLGGVTLWFLVGLGWGIWVNPLTIFDRPSGQALSILTIALYNTTITQFLWIGGLAAVPDITKGSYLFFLKPVIAALLAALFLNQEITFWQVIAIVVISSSVLAEMAWDRLKGKKLP